MKERCLLTGTYCFFLLSCACEKGSFFPVGFQTGSRKLRKKNPESGNQSYERNPTSSSLGAVSTSNSFLSTAPEKKEENYDWLPVTGMRFQNGEPIIGLLSFPRVCPTGSFFSFLCRANGRKGSRRRSMNKSSPFRRQKKEKNKEPP